MDNIKLSIVIPVYNEINTILEVIQRVKNERHSKEIIIVDDASTDGTKELLSQIDEQDIKVIFKDANEGKGAALREGFKYITGDIVIIQDADLEYYPDEYQVLIEKIVKNKADVVFGTRFLGVHRVFYFYHYLGNKLINLAANILLNTNLTDMMTGYKAFKASVLKQLVLKANGFGIEAEITAQVFKRRLRVYEVPISYEGRSYEEGKKIKWTDFFLSLYWLIKAAFLKPCGMSDVPHGQDIGMDTLFKMRTMKNNNYWLYKRMEPYLGKRILEIGAGIGNMSKHLVSKARDVCLTEIDKEKIEYLRNRFGANPYVKIISSDISAVNIPFEFKGVDTAVGVSVLEHIKDDIAALRNIKEILEREGRLILIVPAHKGLFGSLDKNLGHHRRYSKKELTAKLKEAGFAVEHQRYSNFLAAIGWFLEYKIMKRKYMSKTRSQIADKLIPFIGLIEKYIKFPFGLNLFVIARNTEGR
jgi:glycosyltransferase involved in cell wall biosynthesis